MALTDTGKRLRELAERLNALTQLGPGHRAMGETAHTFNENTIRELSIQLNAIVEELNENIENYPDYSNGFPYIYGELWGIRQKLNELEKQLAANRAPGQEGTGGPPDRGGPQSGSEGDGGGGGSHHSAGAGRYWESYAIRYLGGTFVAAAGLLVLLGVDNEGLQELQKMLRKILSEGGLAEYKSVFVFMLIGAAFTYSYIASAPIYFLHLFRYSYFVAPTPAPTAGNDDAGLKKTTVPFKKLVIPFKKLVVSKELMIFSPFLLTALAWIIHLFLQDNLFAYLSMSLGFLLLLSVQLMGVFLFTRGEPVDSNFVHFYERLAHKRSYKNGYGDFIDEYVESYRHLREHGNAFLVIIANVLLTALIYMAPSPMAAALVIVLWTAPATFGWFAATFLEIQTQRDDWPFTALGKKLGEPLGDN